MEKKTINDFTIIYGSQFTEMLGGIIQRGMKDIEEAPFDNDKERMLAKTVLAKTHLEIIMALGMCNPTSSEVKEIFEEYLESELTLDEEEAPEFEDADDLPEELTKLFS